MGTLSNYCLPYSLEMGSLTKQPQVAAIPLSAPSPPSTGVTAVQPCPAFDIDTGPHVCSELFLAELSPHP